MNQISENLFTAIDILIQERLKNLSFDKTIIGTIVDISNFDQFGYYELMYQGSKIIAYSSVKYDINDSVYILIPQNDTSNKKIIIGKYI